MNHLNAFFLLVFASSLTHSANANTAHREGFAKTTDCAALMAVASQKPEGELSAQQAVFEKIGFTLGKAENYRQDGKLQGNTETTYQNKVLTLFQNWPQLSPKQLAQKQKDYQQCIKDAELYDPKTQIPALIEKARQQQ